jgi:OmpA-OmpF porin, OOP family
MRSLLLVSSQPFLRASAALLAIAIASAACQPAPSTGAPPAHAEAQTAEPGAGSASPSETAPVKPTEAPPAATSTAPAPAETARADRDSDGIDDSKDACPDKWGIPMEDPKKNGCPVMVEHAHDMPVILQLILFPAGAHTIDATGGKVLDEVAKYLKENPTILSVAVRGHAAKGEPSPKTLSAARADAVTKELKARGVDAARLVTESHGVDIPLMDNTSEKGRELNKRVDFKIRERVKKDAPIQGSKP